MCDTGRDIRMRGKKHTSRNTPYNKDHSSEDDDDGFLLLPSKAYRHQSPLSNTDKSQPIAPDRPLDDSTLQPEILTVERNLVWNEEGIPI